MTAGRMGTTDWASRYLSATSEGDVQRTLVEELQSYGMIVRTEVHCVLPFDGGGGETRQRRIDVLAVAPMPDGWTGKATPSFSNDGCGYTIAPGGCIGIELKFEEDRRRWKHWRVVQEQAKSAMRAHDFFRSNGEARGGWSVPRPAIMLCADNWTLSGQLDEHGRASLGETDRSLWANGCAVLFRDTGGGLRWQMHICRQDYAVIIPARRS